LPSSACTTLATVEPPGGVSPVIVLLVVAVLVAGVVLLNKKSPETISGISGRIGAAYKAASAWFKSKAKA